MGLWMWVILFAMECKPSLILGEVHQVSFIIWLRLDGGYGLHFLKVEYLNLL